MMEFSPCPKPEPKLKKKRQRIKAFSEKQKRYNKQRQKAYQEMEKQPMFCRGCGSPYQLSHSHRIGQANKEHVGNVNNIDILCLDCHPLWERGWVWQLDNGQSAMQWLKETDFGRYAQKRLKMLKRVEENGLLPENLPGWAQQILKELE